MGKTAAAVADIAQYQTKEKSIDSLQEIHVENAEQYSLQDICRPKRKCAPCLTERDTTENKLLGDEKSIDSLQEIHVENAEQYSLQDICRPKRKCAPCLTERDTTENKLLGDRCKKHGIAEHTDC